MTCDRCGKNQSAETMIYSSHTRAHYCGIGKWAACDSRAKKLVAANVEAKP